ncbi:MAG: hypothetical protein WA206_04645, partial [Candidatus Binatus sp.]
MARKKKTKRATLCYLCGRPKADSRDHVIATCFFSPPFPENLVTLPAHHVCQAKFSASEDYLRIYLASLADDGSNPQVPGAVVTRAIKRNEPLRKQIAAGLLAAEDIYTEAGVYIGTAPAVRFDPERFFPALRKIVRALVFREYGVVLKPADDAFRWKIHDRPDPKQFATDNLLRHSYQGLSYPGVFDSKYSSGAQHCWWFLRFYQGTPISCLLLHEGKLP